MSPLRAFYNRDHPKPPHEDNPADSRIEDYRSRPVVTRELSDEHDNFQMSLALVFISLGKVVIETPSTLHTHYLPVGATTEGAPSVFTIYSSSFFRHGLLFPKHKAAPPGTTPWRARLCPLHMAKTGHNTILVKTSTFQNFYHACL